MDVQKLDADNILSILPDRCKIAHKGDFGRILLLCGSRGYTGAAALAAMGALRSGAGLVYLAVPACIYEIEAIKLNEAIVLPFSDLGGKFSADCEQEILALLPKMDAVLIGPGLGQSYGTFAIVSSVLKNADIPVVLDADGINLMRDHIDILRGRTCPTVLTPHEGEFCRMYGKTIKNRVADAKSLAANTGSVVLLKGNETVITDGDSVYINTTGNPGMAVGGSGDVLAGIITSLIGQGIQPLKAAACGAWLHGAAGDICAQEIGQYGMLPSDMLRVLPRLMK